MSSEALDQMVSLLPALTVGERKKLIVKIRKSFPKAKLSAIETTRLRQAQYKRDMRSGKAVFGREER